jgi:hypothetical protein
MEPPSALYSPTSRRSKVDLPVPFKPIRPILSLGLMCKLAPSYSAREPKWKSRSEMEIM